MDQQALLQRLTQILHDVYDIDADNVTPDTKLSEIGIDSMISADLMIEIENALDFTFTNMDLARSATVQDVINLVQASLASAAD